MSQITEQEIENVQIAWGEGIVKIGEVFKAGGDYSATAADHIDKFYNYGADRKGSVLFKPTLASKIQFRPTFEGALSYFVGGNINFPEDHGFAIKPWSNVEWESAGTHIIGNMAVAMGNYFFTIDGTSDKVKVEYSFSYTKIDKELKIILHGSHIPFYPKFIVEQSALTPVQ